MALVISMGLRLFLKWPFCRFLKDFYKDFRDKRRLYSKESIPNSLCRILYSENIGGYRLLLSSLIWTAALYYNISSPLPYLPSGILCYSWGSVKCNCQSQICWSETGSRLLASCCEMKYHADFASNPTSNHSLLIVLTVFDGRDPPTA